MAQHEEGPVDEFGVIPDRRTFSSHDFYGSCWGNKAPRERLAKRIVWAKAAAPVQAVSQILLRVLRCWGSRWELLSFRRKSRKGWQETGSGIHPVLGCGQRALTLWNTDWNTDRNTKSCSKVDRGAEALLLGLLLSDPWVWAPGSSHSVFGFLFSVVSAELFSIYLLQEQLQTWLSLHISIHTIWCQGMSPCPRSLSDLWKAPPQ